MYKKTTEKTRKHDQKTLKKRYKNDKKTHPKKNPQKIDFGRGAGLPKPSQNRSKSDKKRYKKESIKMRTPHSAQPTQPEP